MTENDYEVGVSIEAINCRTGEQTYLAGHHSPTRLLRPDNLIQNQLLKSNDNTGYVISRDNVSVIL